MHRRARARAVESRRSLGLGLLMPVDIWKVLQMSGVSVLVEPLASSISGLFARKGNAQLILINSAKSLGHQNFTAAHEWFHLCYNPDLAWRVCSVALPGQRDRVEREADLFAAYFFMPDEALESFLAKRKKAPGQLEMIDVIALEQAYGMSHEAALIRLEETGWLDSDSVKAMKDGVRRSARELGYSDQLYRPTGETSFQSDYAAKAALALKRGLISEGRYEELLLEAGLEDLLYGDEEGEIEAGAQDAL